MPFDCAAAATSSAGLAALAPAIDAEAVLIADPEAIVVSGSEGREAARIEAWRRRAPLTAVRRGNLFWLPPESILQHTPRILDGAERLCADLAAARTRRD
jgi:iron complex transport system substrate-binding protein